MPSNRNLIVLVGAGASFDCHVPAFTSIVNSQWRPPLTQDLFDPRECFQEILHRYPKAEAAATAFLARRTATPDFSIEAFLSELLSRKDGLSRQQGLYLSLYLRDLFCEISTNYLASSGVKQSMSAYTELVGALYEAQAADKFATVSILTTNYDLILDRVIERHFRWKFGELQHYLNFHKGWGLIKFHGSANWWHLIGSFEARKYCGRGGGVQRLTMAIEAGVDLRAHCNGSDVLIALEGARSQSEHDHVWFPAIAVPVDRKEGAVCPKAQVAYLEALLKDQTCGFDLLVLGFSAVDLDVLRVFEDHWPRIGRLQIVNGNKKWSAETRGRLFNAGLKPSYCRNWDESLWSGGFGDYILMGEGLRRFLFA